MLVLLWFERVEDHQVIAGGDNERRAHAVAGAGVGLQVLLSCRELIDAGMCSLKCCRREARRLCLELRSNVIGHGHLVLEPVEQ